MSKEIVLPKEGDLLFQDTPHYLMIFGCLVAALVCITAYAILGGSGGLKYVYLFGAILSGVGFLIFLVIGYIEGFDSQCKGYYFKNKIVFYRRYNRSEHQFEVVFQDVKYFLNQKQLVNLVENDEQNVANPNGRFYNQLELTKKYEKSKLGIVDFLNARVIDAKRSGNKPKKLDQIS